MILEGPTHSGEFLGIVDRIGQGIEARLGLGAVKQVAGLDLERLGSFPADRPTPWGGWASMATASDSSTWMAWVFLTKWTRAIPSRAGR